MNEYSIIGIALALIGVLKGKDIWDFLKSWIEAKGKKDDRVIEFYEKQIKEYEKKLKVLEKSNTRYKKMLK